MKTLDYTFVADQKELEEMIDSGYAMIISVVNDTRGKFAACLLNNYTEVFEEITGHEYNDNDGTHGIAFPITETFGVDSIFNI